MSAFDNVPVGSTVVYKNDCEVHVWHGGCIVSILCAYSGAELDCWTTCEQCTLSEIMERAHSRMEEFSEDV